MKRIAHLFFVGLLSCGLLLSIAPVASAQSATERPDGWTEASHSNDVEPNYAVVFPDDQVNVLTITIDPENWAAMQANMTEIFGAAGSRGARGFGGQVRNQTGAPAQPTSPLAPPTDEQQDSPLAKLAADQPISPLAPPADADEPTERPQPPVGFGTGGGANSDFSSENPMWVTATIGFDGNIWTNVGVRYKGNSSLRSSWESQSQKLPFKLDFDQFEDQYPAIDNQRFYGFKQLSLANGFGDATFMRDAITYELLDEAGLVAADTAFYEIHLDYGEGPVNLGLYTAIEVIDDTVIPRYFGDDSGNIYEGDGRGVSLAEGTFDQISSSFQKENNEDEADWSDIEALYETLHDVSRTEEPAAWRAELEAIFDVDTFLRWLALSATLQHWDTYGAMTHNFYLYHDPESDQLVWISWDHNFVLGASMGGGLAGGAMMQAPPAGGQRPGGLAGRRGGPGGDRTVTFDKANVGPEWPLIRYLLNDPVYAEQYQAELSSIGDDIFDPEELIAQYELWADLLTPYIEDKREFDLGVTGLITATNRQAEALKSYLTAASATNASD